jgi:hypothetical protein
MEPRAAEPVFVFADDGLNVFADLDALLGWIEAPDVEDGVYEAIFTVSGEVIEAQASGRHVVLKPTGRVELSDLQQRVRASADRFSSDPADLQAVAHEMLRADWEARWPKRPRWLARRLHGDPPQGQ